MLLRNCTIVAMLLLLWIRCVLLQRPGNCPPLVAVNEDNCLEDKHCADNLKCCSTAYGSKACVQPVSYQRRPIANKPGKCPPSEDRWLCGHGCSNDGDCLGRKKCCQFDCGGHWCTNPIY